MAAGTGGRTSGIGALLLGIPACGGLQFVGRVGTGFTEKELTRLKGMLKPLHTDESPFNAKLPAQDAKASPSFVRSWSARSDTANEPPTAGCANPAGAACGRTRNRETSIGNEGVPR